MNDNFDGDVENIKQILLLNENKNLKIIFTNIDRLR